MGQVIQAFHHTSVVRLVTDGQSKVGVTFGPGNQYTGIVDGQGPSNSMTADLVPPHTPLHKGEEHVHERAATPRRSRRGSRWRPSRPSTPPRGRARRRITVDPAADLSQLAYVDVVQWVPPA